MESYIATLDVAHNVYCRYERCMEVTSYPGLLALYALAQLADVRGGLLKEKARQMLLRYPDNVKHPHYNFESYRVGGNGRAYLVMKGFDTEGKELLRKYAQVTFEAPVSAEGIQCMPNAANRPDSPVWIDVVTATTPFMVMAGVALDNEAYINYGATQCFRMYDLFEDKENRLLHQSRGFMPDTYAISADHWSRGNGWGIVGLADILQYLPAGSAIWEEAAKRLKKHSSALLAYQTKRGLWRQSIACELAWEESSGTALIAYALGIGLRTGVLDRKTYFPAFERAIQGLAGWCINGDFSTEYSCEGCLCPGYDEEKGSVKAYLSDVHPRKDEAHSYGPIMLAMIEAHKNGIELIGWRKDGKK